MATKSRKARAKRRGVKAGGESPCKTCRSYTVKPKRNRLGQFTKKKR